MGQPVAHHDPVDRRQPGVGTPVILFPYHLGIHARSQRLAIYRVELGDDIDIEQAVIDRRDQGVRI